MVQPPAILPDTPKTRQDMADYMTTVAHADACLGTVMDPLERHNLASDTAFRDARSTWTAASRPGWSRPMIRS